MSGAPLTTAVAAAKAFADAKPDTDQIAVSTFASQSLPPTPFSPSTTDSDVALRSISVDSHEGTKLFDDLLLDLSAPPTRRLPAR